MSAPDYEWHQHFFGLNWGSAIWVYFLEVQNWSKWWLVQILYLSYSFRSLSHLFLILLILKIWTRTQKSPADNHKTHNFAEHFECAEKFNWPTSFCKFCSFKALEFKSFSAEEIIPPGFWRCNAVFIAYKYSFLSFSRV